MFKEQLDLNTTDVGKRSISSRDICTISKIPLLMMGLLTVLSIPIFDLHLGGFEAHLSPKGAGSSFITHLDEFAFERFIRLGANGRLS